MPTSSQPERLTENEIADMADRVRRFRGAWRADRAAPIERCLPAAGERHRGAVLVQLILIDMEYRAEGGLPFRVEQYAERFPDELPPAAMPVALLGAEYQLRHRLEDHPKLTEYQARFPDRFDELVRYLAPPEPMEGTQMSGRLPGADTLSRVPVEPPKQVGELVLTNMGEMDATPPVRMGGSTILPTGTPYQLVRKLGSGAFGEVFEALAPGGIRVAVKRILRDVDHPASKSEKESLDAIKELSHPFLLKTNAYWVFDDRLVIVMELADGSLADRVEYHKSQGRDAPPLKELIPLFEEAAEALDYLHSQNISHRDIKPENILVMKGHAKVADFGLARLQEHAMTMVGSTVGTPAYMAPEMWQQKVSLQSDQYSLAATYVRVRLGRPLFQTAVLIDMANYHINETPNLDPLPEPEQQVLLKALSKSPNERFASCLEFAHALRVATITPSMDTNLGISKLTGGTGLRSTLVPQSVLPDSAPAVPARLFGALRVIVIALACALAVGAVNWATRPDKKVADNNKADPGTVSSDTKPPVAPAEEAMGGPEGWLPVKGADATFRVNGKPYYRKLTRTVAGESLVALLVAPTSGQTDHPDPFYILENKVTNRVFAELWKGVPVHQAPTFARIKKDYPRYLKDDAVWRKGAADQSKKESDPDFYLGTEGKQAGVPVLGVTLPEALLVAKELRGQLPTIRQWQKAVGLLNDDTRVGTAGPEITVPKDLKGKARGDFILERLGERNLALGLTAGPWPVEKRTADLSYCGAHQLATNGLEWLASDPEGRPITLEDLNVTSGSRDAMVVGRHAASRDVPTFDVIRMAGTQEWDRVTGDFAAGFRVVLRPEPR